MSDPNSEEDPLFEIDVVIWKHRLIMVPNVHAILAFSALVLMGILVYTEIVTHGEATALIIAEIFHFAGWAYLELPEALMIEEL